MTKNIVLLALTGFALVFAGCTTWGDIDKGLATLDGRSIEYAIGQLGLPDAEQQIAGRKVYVWGTHAVGGGFPVTKTTTYTGTVGSTPFYGTSSTLEQSPTYDLYCTLKLVVDESGTVFKYQYEGNLGACQRYAGLASNAAKVCKDAYGGTYSC